MVGRGIRTFVAELLPDIHVVLPAVPEVPVWHVNVPDADVGAAYRQLDGHPISTATTGWVTANDSINEAAPETTTIGPSAPVRRRHVASTKAQ